MKIIIIGYTGSGKTTVASAIAKLWGTTAINTSDYLINDYAQATGIDINKILSNKDKFRYELYQYGRARQDDNPLYLIEEPAKISDVITGLRNIDEIIAARKTGLFDLVIWVHMDDCKRGNTDNLEPHHADIIINNNGTLSDLKRVVSIVFSKRLT